MVYMKRDLEKDRGESNEERKKVSRYQLARIHQFLIKLMKQRQMMKIKVSWLNLTFG